MRDQTSSRKRTTVIIILALLLVAIVTFDIIALLVFRNSDSTNPDDQTNQTFSEYEAKIKNATTEEERATLYDARAEQIYTNSDGERSEEVVNQILADAYAAEAANPTAETAMNIAKYETIYGSQEKADYYYNLALERDPNLKNLNQGGSG